MIGALALLAVNSVAKSDLSAVKAPPGPIRTGQGDFIYEYQPSLLQVPPSPKSGGQNVLNGHGIARDSAGNLYFTFQPANVAEDTQCLAKFNPDGTNGILLGDKGPTGLSQGTPHGLRLEHDAAKKQDFLYHANNAALVFKTDTDGKVVYKIDLNHWEQDNKAFWPCKPTDATVVGDTLYVSDGYGTSWIHMFNKHDGTYLKSFGGAGKTSADPVKFHTPHSLSADPRFPGQLLITDRSNERLVFVDHDGHFKSEVDVSKGGQPSPGSNGLPCSSHFMTDAKAGMVSIIPALGDSHADVEHGMNFSNTGSVGIYDKNNMLVSEIEVAKYLWKTGHQHPHDALFMPNGDVVVACYGGGCGGKPSAGCQASQFPHQTGASGGTISYWKRVAPPPPPKPLPLPLPTKADAAVVSGQGDWKYQFMPGLVNLPQTESHNDLNGHGLCKDKEGNIYFTFVPNHVVASTQVR